MSFFEQIGYLIKNYYKTFLSGLGVTILLAVVGTFVGLILGMILALGRNLKPNKNDNVFIKILKIICSKLCLIYIEVFRGTPMMVQALIIFFGGYALGISWNPIICGLVIISLNTAAYMGEIVKSGLNGVDQGQVEGAKSLGMKSSTTSLKIILPQALRNALPTIGNELIVNIKDSSVLNVIGVTELYKQINLIAGKTYAFIECYVILALVYLLLTLIASFALKLVEKKLDGEKISINPFRFMRKKTL